MHVWSCYYAKFLALVLLLCARPYHGSVARSTASELEKDQILISVRPKGMPDGPVPTYYAIGQYHRLLEGKWLLDIKDAIAGNAHSILLQNCCHVEAKQDTWIIKDTQHVESASLQSVIDTWLQASVPHGDALCISAAKAPGKALVQFLGPGQGAPSFTATTPAKWQGHWQVQMQNSDTGTCFPIGQTTMPFLFLAADAVTAPNVSLFFFQVGKDFVANDAEIVLSFGHTLAKTALLHNLLQQVLKPRSKIVTVQSTTGKDGYQFTLLVKKYPSNGYVNALASGMQTKACKLRGCRINDRRGNQMKGSLRSIDSDVWYMNLEATEYAVVESFSSFEAAIKTKFHQPQMPLTSLVLKRNGYIAPQLLIIYQLEIADSLYPRVVSALVEHVICGPKAAADPNLLIVFTVMSTRGLFNLEMGFSSTSDGHNIQSW